MPLEDAFEGAWRGREEAKERKRGRLVIQCFGWILKERREEQSRRGESVSSQIGETIVVIYQGWLAQSAALNN